MLHQLDVWWIVLFHCGPWMHVLLGVVSGIVLDGIWCGTLHEDDMCSMRSVWWEGLFCYIYI